MGLCLRLSNLFFPWIFYRKTSGGYRFKGTILSTKENLFGLGSAIINNDLNVNAPQADIKTNNSYTLWAIVSKFCMVTWSNGMQYHGFKFYLKKKLAFSLKYVNTKALILCSGRKYITRKLSQEMMIENNNNYYNFYY